MGMKGEALTDIIGPLQPHRQTPTPRPVPLDGLHARNGGKVLDKDDGPRGGEMGGVVDDGGHDEATLGGEPDV